MSWWQRLLHKPFFIKLLHWEYWSMTYVYFPTYFYFLWLCVRSGWKYFFSAANPSIENGGFLMESKKDIYDLLPDSYYPKTLFFKGHTSAETVLAALDERKMNYPLIIKPDIGMRGLAAKKIDSADELRRYVAVFSIHFLIQEFVSYRMEAGIFFYKFPGDAQGKISGIVTKEFLQVKGNGRQTLLELLKADKRFILQVDALKKEYKDLMNEIIPDGETRELVPYGNHARGAKFIDDSFRIDEELTRVINGFCQQVPEFYYGRLDIRFDNWEDLKKGNHFSVIELNGSGSEPTHMYDPAHSLFFAWKEISRHYRILFRIARANKKRGYSYMTFSEGSRMFRNSRNYSKQLRDVHEALLHA